MRLAASSYIALSPFERRSESDETSVLTGPWVNAEKIYNAAL